MNSIVLREFHCPMTSFTTFSLAQSRARHARASFIHRQVAHILHYESSNLLQIQHLQFYLSLHDPKSTITDNQCAISQLLSMPAGIANAPTPISSMIVLPVLKRAPANSAKRRRPPLENIGCHHRRARQKNVSYTICTIGLETLPL